MLYIGIPAFNEVETIGLLLWRIRKVLQEFPREYELFVYNDGSTDATAETLASYAEVLPLTLIGGSEHVGYAGAIDGLCREIASHTRYPRRDALILMQGDFTDQPEHLPELIKRFEGGADLVVAQTPQRIDAPKPVRWLRRVAPLLTRPFVSVAGIDDPFGTYRLYRLSVIKDLVRAAGIQPVIAGEGWGANVELLAKAATLSRRVEAAELLPRYDLRHRETRIRLWPAAMTLLQHNRRARARLALLPKAPPSPPDGADRPPRRRGKPSTADRPAPETRAT